MRVVAFTSGWTVPSSRFRVRQFVPPLETRGVTVSEHPSEPGKYDPVPFGVPKFLFDRKRLKSRTKWFDEAAGADVVWLEREFLVGRRSEELAVGSAARRVFDVDDAIFLSGEKGYSEEIAAGCAGVIAGNSWLADHYRPHVKKVWIVPTAVDPADWAQRPDAPPKEGFVVGWTGTSANFRYLLEVEPALAELLARHRDARVRVVADAAPPWKGLPSAQVEFVRWTETAEREAVRGMSVGLMPLADEPWAKGKCAAKMLVYAAAAIPSVVTPVGVNGDILAKAEVGLAARTTAEWLGALEALYSDRARVAAMGQAGEALVREEYSVAVNAGRLAAIFEEVAEAARRG